MIPVLAVPGLWWQPPRDRQGHRDRHTDSRAWQAGLALPGVGASPSRDSPVPHRHSTGDTSCTGTWGHCGHSPGTHTASRESKMTLNTNGFVPFQTKLLF